jgi:hypothetical protein
MKDILDKRETVLVWLTFAGIIATGVMVGNILGTVAIAGLIALLQ